MLADAGGMQLVRWPKQFDVIVTDNLFGDMLSDVAAMLTGSLGMLPSASLGAPDPKTGKRKALYEPVHGSAPDISGQGIANPIAMIASFAMCLRYSFEMVAEADRLEAAIAAVLDEGYRTARHHVGRHEGSRHHRHGRRHHRKVPRSLGVTSGELLLAEIGENAPRFGSRAYRRQLNEYPCGHFDFYPGGPFHEEAATGAADWFRRHLASLEF